MAVANSWPPVQLYSGPTKKLPRCGAPHPKNPKWGCMRSPEHSGRHQLWRWESDSDGYQVFLENFPEDE